ncbi:MAG: cyclic nucleotide-binding domain-containing protein [Deltaproteobacteria bacterium]|nr:cyclic nucleotide-binding domain-containing protein [Deltaproteobacteria bacterium]
MSPHGPELRAEARDPLRDTKDPFDTQVAPRGTGEAISGQVTDLQRWANAVGATPRVALPEAPSKRPTRPTTRPSLAATPVAPAGSLAPPGPTRPTHRPAADAADPAPTGRYVPESILGRGGVGEVDLVFDRDLGRRVAKTRLRAELRAEPTLIQAFLEEAMITGALEHPGIVPVHDIGVSPGEGPWYTMKRHEGEPLSSILSRLRGAHAETQKAWPLPRLVEVFVQVLRAIAHAHARGVVHCDLKPGNVLVGDLGEVIVVDWGLAKVLGDGGKDQARARLWSGSPGYMPPEQATSDDISRLDPRSDIWALGAILYELVTLVVPQAGADGKVPEPASDGSFAPLVPITRRTQGPYRREVPPELAAICDRALSADPDQRYPTTLAVLADAEAWLQGTRERERRDARATHASALVDRVLVGGSTSGEAALLALDEVSRAVVEALAESPQRSELAWRASSLYWFVFRAFHRGDLARDDATRILDRLAAMVVPGPEVGSAIEPWLDALEEVADDAPSVRALADRLRALSTTRLFSALDGHELLPVASAVEPRTLAPGDVLFAEGEVGEALWILVRGRVVVEAAGKVLTTLEAPVCVGEIALVDRSTRTATVRAETSVEALLLTADRFDALVRRHGAIAMGVMRLLAERLRAATLREVGDASRVR